MLVAATAAGCGDGPSQSPTQPPTDGPLVSYTRSGGLATTAQHLVVEQDGSATVRVEGPGNIGGDLRLSGAELARLRAAIDDATLDVDSPPATCADCFTYEITAGGETASFDQTQIPAATAPLVALLEEVVARETPSGPARRGGA